MTTYEHTPVRDNAAELVETTPLGVQNLLTWLVYTYSNVLQTTFSFTTALDPVSLLLQPLEKPCRQLRPTWVAALPGHTDAKQFTRFPILVDWVRLIGETFTPLQMLWRPLSQLGLYCIYPLIAEDDAVLALYVRTLHRAQLDRLRRRSSAGDFLARPSDVFLTTPAHFVDADQRLRRWLSNPDNQRTVTALFTKMRGTVVPLPTDSPCPDHGIAHDARTLASCSACSLYVSQRRNTLMYREDHETRPMSSVSMLPPVPVQKPVYRELRIIAQASFGSFGVSQDQGVVAVILPAFIATLSQFAHNSSFITHDVATESYRDAVADALRTSITKLLPSSRYETSSRVLRINEAELRRLVGLPPPVTAPPPPPPAKTRGRLREVPCPAVASGTAKLGCYRGRVYAALPNPDMRDPTRKVMCTRLGGQRTYAAEQLKAVAEHLEGELKTELLIFSAWLEANEGQLLLNWHKVHLQDSVARRQALIAAGKRKRGGPWLHEEEEILTKFCTEREPGEFNAAEQVRLTVLLPLRTIDQIRVKVRELGFRYALGYGYTRYLGSGFRLKRSVRIEQKMEAAGVDMDPGWS